jgi:hypothetical protein
MGIRVKGQAIVAFERTLAELKGPDAMSALAPHLGSELVQVIKNREVLSVGWYPIEWYAALHDAAQNVHGAAISREIGRAATRHDVTTLYRFILRFLSPTTLVSQIKRIFGMAFDGGEVVIEENKSGSARIRFVGCPGSNRGVWEDMLGSIETLLELCGGRESSARVVAGGSDGDAAMTCVLTWK